jgi:hypothetical protein
MTTITIAKAARERFAIWLINLWPERKSREAVSESARCAWRSEGTHDGPSGSLWPCNRLHSVLSQWERSPLARSAKLAMLALFGPRAMSNLSP